MKEIEPLESKPLIVIPTHKRVGKVKVLNAIPEELFDVTYLAVSPDQEESYKKVYPYVNMLVVDESVKCIAQKRQACIDLLPKGKVIMLDDMITPYIKRTEKHKNGMPKLPVGDGRFMDRKNNVFLELYNTINEDLNVYPQLGISPREGNNTKEGYGTEIHKVYGAQAMRTDIFEKENIRFDGMFQQDPLCMLYEDYYVTLRLIQEGYKNFCYFDWAYNHHHNSKGGNSGSRTHEIQEHSVKKLQETFGEEFIKIWQYAGASQWPGLENRWEVKVMYMKKYYNHIQEKIEMENTPNIFDLFGDQK